MRQETHRPVLLREAVEGLRCRPGGLWVDATVGDGGHAEAILEATAPDGRLLGLDRDGEILERARRRLAPYGERVVLRHADHRDLPALLDAPGGGAARGAIFDLGVSSLQLDDPERGFSFQKDGPLDMRMDRTEGATAADLVATLPEREIASILARFGEEPAARHFARAIVRERARQPIATTARLAEVVSRAAGTRRPRRIHPATRAFQALRIAVNRELLGLDRAIEETALRLEPGGRLAVISFHSLEDRIIKRAFRSLASRCRCPRGLPICGCGLPDLLRLVGRRAVRPSDEEVRANPRSRSARLRVAERLAAGAPGRGRPEGLR